MQAYLKKLPKEIQDLLKLSGQAARQMDLRAYLVGGIVRDLLLGVKNFDLDILVEGDGIVFAEVMAATLEGKLTRHRRFGTATVLLAHGLKIDIATARKEIYPYPGSLPEVSPGSLRDDLLRRDFTINAMAIAISGDGFGKIIDIFSGQRDLRGSLIRVLHDLSFIDDPTRILRAIRFEQRLGFRIETHTLGLLKAASRKKMLQKIQPQRLRDELILLLKEKVPLRQLRRIKILVGFDFISPHLAFSLKQYRLLEAAGKEISWFKNKHYTRRHLDSWIIYLMGLLDALDLAQTKSACKKFAFSGGEEKRVFSYKRFGLKVAEKLSKAGIKPAEVFGLLEPLSYETIVMIKAKYRNPDIQRHIADFFAVYNGMRLHISGEDLHRLGISPGPAYKKIFSRVLKAKLNGLVKTKGEELSLIVKLTGK